MDKISQLGRHLGRTADTVDASLRRAYPTYTVIEHTRDIFDEVISFDMDFVVPQQRSGSTYLDLRFNLPPELGTTCCVSTSICAACEIFTSGSIHTTQYPFTTVWVFGGYADGEYELIVDVDFEILNDQTIDVFFDATETDWIKICYVHNVYTEPPPVPSPPPESGERPFDPPTSPSSSSVPGTISAVGLIDASEDLNNWIESISDGSTISFPPSAIYRVDAGLLLVGRNDLVLNGNGAELRLNGGSSDGLPVAGFQLRGCNNIKIENFIVVGSNTNTTNIFVPGYENQHILSLAGFGGGPPSSYIEMTNVTGSRTFADAAYLEGRNIAPFEPSHHVWIHNNTFSYIGRMGIASIDVNDLLVENNTFDKVGIAVFDVEPNFEEQVVQRNTFRENSIGSFGHFSQLEGYVLSVAYTESNLVEDIIVTNNTSTGITAQGYDGKPRGLNSKVIGKFTVGAGIRVANVTFTDNVTDRAAHGPVIYAINVDNITVTGNVQPLLSGSLGQFDNSTGVTYQP